jgi:N-acetylglucosamine-6-phosphate deacetylase
MLFSNGRIVTTDGVLDRGWFRVEGSRIVEVGSGERPAEGSRPAHEGEDELDLEGRWAGPGFIDVHVHGGAGHEVMEGDDESVPALARFFASRGVTSFLPTTYTASRTDTLRALQVVADHVGVVDGGAEVLGAHMEGPYLNPVRKGAHREHLLRGADRDELEAFLATGVVRMMAVAPELEANAGLVEELRARGVTVAAGHTDATYADMASAVDRGATLVTHVFNGMRGIHHREPGAAGGALALDGLRCELIADGVHVDPGVMRLVWRAKGPRGVVLITDAGKAAGMPEGTYERAGRTLEVRDGVMRLPDGTISSSVQTLDSGFRNFCAANSLSFDQAWDTVSRNPAEAIGVAERKGSLSAGKDADVTVLDDDGTVCATVVGGRVVHRSW